MSKLLTVVCIILVISLTAAAYAHNTIRLLINGSELSDCDPQLIAGRVMVPVRRVAEAFGATVHWDRGTVHISASWPSTLAAALARASNHISPDPISGEITCLWRIRPDLLLLEHVSNMDYDYYLCNTTTGNTDRIIWFIDNARYTDHTPDKLNFIGKGGSDTGNYEFPYLITYDIAASTLTRQQLYLDRNVVLGSGGWPHNLTSITTDDHTVLIHLAVTEDAVVAGGHRTPLTITNITCRALSLLIHDVRIPEPGHLTVTHPLISRIDWEPLPGTALSAFADLIHTDFPYGGAGIIYDPDQPATKITIHLHHPTTYHIATTTNDLTLTLAIDLK